MKFTLKDFYKGLMLAGLVKPANAREESEFKALQEYEKKPRNLYVKLRK